MISCKIAILCLLGLVNGQYRFSTIKDENMPFVVEQDEALETGFGPELLKMIMDKVNDSATYTLGYVADGRYGTPKVDGSWTGLIGEILSGNSDAAIAPLTITTKRMEVVDFSVPILASGIVAMVKKSGASDYYQSIQDLTTGDDVTFAALENGAISRQFSQAGQTETINKIVEKGLGQLYANFSAALEDLRSRDDIVAFMSEQMAAQIFTKKAPCDLREIGPPLNTIHYGIAFPKGSDLKEPFDRAIIDLGLSGHIQDLKFKWSNHGCN